mmetsp:Transcript_10682/g.22226  ORF Transcript_10682/g.22226 Transcript_10682/m.22226 type:complete len:128 (-) Transcript_10682:123-506(-)|eukprot:CAMPEP_0118934004 /NCGR_PEP_ID=MMETSP1169-20130426/13282_1 /TAXON_ID=36882 /ORGANISM="Pyramimonas obovata, Strain CCMP722" /LENGTH=127 /DNA_ID=CAMNT_0006876857 /DNA_START=40 /DNA_END=423 /DNA_ORIENTATION=+
MAPVALSKGSCVALAGANARVSSSKHVAPKALTSSKRVAVGRKAVVTKAMDGETIGAVLAGVAGISAGLGIPIFFAKMEARDKDRVEELRDLNRANLKATGETLSEDELEEMRPTRYLDRREFVDDD